MILDPAIAVELALTGALYVWATRRLPRWEPHRTGLFLAGLIAIAVALGPLDGAADSRLSAHMVQHLILILVAPPLLLAGAPLRLTLATVPAETARRLVHGARRGPLRVLVWPPVALAVYAAILLATHIPAFYDLALAHSGVHAAEHTLYLFAGLILWAPVLGPAPLPRTLSPLGRILYLFMAMAPGTAIGLWLMTSSAVHYPAYIAEAGSRAAALADQGTAGMVMWATGAAVMSAAAVAIGWKALVAEEERQRIRDAHALRGAR